MGKEISGFVPRMLRRKLRPEEEYDSGELAVW